MSTFQIILCILSASLFLYQVLIVAQAHSMLRSGNYRSVAVPYFPFVVAVALAVLAALL